MEGLHFESDLDNDKLKQAIDESLARIKGLSDATVSGGERMDKSFEMTAENIDKTFRDIDSLTATHTNSVKTLQEQYNKLSKEAADAFAKKDDKSYLAIKKKADAVQGEINVRKKLLVELSESADALQKEEKRLEEVEKKTNKAASANTNFRKRLKELREELIQMEIDGKRGSEAYRMVQQEAANLTDAIGDATAQANILAHDQATAQGIISGLTGIAGAFSVATGTIALFAGESEELQKIMLKVQAVMSITIGLQQVQQTVNKDSEFMLVTMGNLKNWWSGIVAKATVSETANTAATVANTTAKQSNAVATAESTALTAGNSISNVANTAAVKTGTLANLGLAGSFRLVGIAIKSIPGVGWLIAGVTAVLAIVRALGSSAREAAAAQDKLNTKIADAMFEPLGAIERLSLEYKKLGDDLVAKKKFVEQNKEEFNKLGVAVNGVADAQQLLIDNKDKFIDAQIAKTRSLMMADEMEADFKKLVKLRLQYEQAEDKDTSVYIQTSSMGTGKYVTTNAKKEALNALEEQKKATKEKLEEVVKMSNEASALMKEVGLTTTNEIVENSLKAYREQLEAKRKLLENTTSKKEYDAIIKDMEAIQKKVEAIAGATDKTKVKDPFIEQLNKKKEAYAEYGKWISSTDKAIREAAKVEFATLLKDGQNYLEYLESRRTQLEKVANRTIEQEKQLKSVYSQIAEETNMMAVDAFNKALQNQLDGADNVLAKLDLIQKKREELKASDVDAKDKGKTLDKAEEAVVKELQSNTQQLLQDYVDYTDRKIAIDKKYFEDIAILNKAYSDAASEEEKERIKRSIDARSDAYKKDSKTSGDADYDEMLKSYANFEEKKQNIINEFDAKRLKAVQHGNEAMIVELDKAQTKALSGLALDELIQAPEWSRLFSDLNSVATKELESIIKWAESQESTLGVKFDPKDIESIQNAVGKAKAEISNRNPFKALVDGVKDYKNAGDDVAKSKALTNIFKDAGASADLLHQSMDAVTGGLESMGVELSDSAKEILGGLGGMMDGVSQLSKGLASNNPIDILQGSIGLLTSAMDVFDSRSRRQEKRIQQHAKALKELEKAYKDLEKAASEALGSDKYGKVADLTNLKKQNDELNAMIDAENGKKKKKRSKKRIEEWNEAIQENKEKMAELINEVRDQLIGIDAPDIASQLGNAMIDAFATGGDAAKVWGAKVDDIVSGIARRMLIEKALEKPMGDLIDSYSKQWVKSDGSFVGFDKVMKDLPKLSKDLNNFADGFGDAIKDLPEDVKSILFGGLSDVDMSLTGSIKGITQEQASMLGGQTNAIRINQVDANVILRDILMQMITISNNTAYNKYLQSIDSKLNNYANKSDTLRAGGFN